MTSKPILALVLVAITGPIGAGCGGDDDHSSSTATGSPTQTTAGGTSQAGDGRSGDGRSRDSGGSSGASSGGDQASSGRGSGGSNAPALRAPRKRSLQRYLARRYRATPWYPLLRKLRISGGHVTVYLKFPPESDDEGPPVLACTAVSSYGKQVTRVSVYGSPTQQGKTFLLKEC
jgi:hypothetical protein